MAHSPTFDTDENRILMVVCARKTIRNIGLGGVIWGLINIGVGVVVLSDTWLNLGLVLLGLIMLGAGVVAMRRPALHALLTEAIVSLLLLAWNIGITILNVRAGDTSHINGHGFIGPIVAAVIFFQQYARLRPLGDAIQSLDPQALAGLLATCQELLKRKIKDDPDIVDCNNRSCRIRRTGDSVFCVQRNLQRAFTLPLAEFRQSFKNLEKKRLQLVLAHPLGKLAYGFDKASSLKIKAWLGGAA